MQSGAYRTILTHFSTRYPELPAADFSARPDVGVAMDFMAVGFKTQGFTVSFRSSTLAFSNFIPSARPDVGVAMDIMAVGLK